MQGQSAIPLTGFDQAALNGKGTIFLWCYSNNGERQTESTSPEIRDDNWTYL